MNTHPTLKPPFCSEHRTPMVWGETDFRHVEDGIEVLVRHVPAWVCIHGDDAAFAPGVSEDLITTIRQLIRVAKQARSHQPAFPQQEYLVREMA